MTDLAPGVRAAHARRDVDDGAAKQVGAGGFEPVAMSACERVAARKPPPETEVLSARDDGAFHRADIGDDRPGLEVWDKNFELCEVRRRRRGQYEEIGRA